METKTTIEFYSDILEDDVVLQLEVNYETVDEVLVTGEMYGGGEPMEEPYSSVQFIKGDVKVLNNDLDNATILEFFNQFEDYQDEIRQSIEDQLN
jgi:hypothetical protein